MTFFSVVNNYTTTAVLCGSDAFFDCVCKVRPASAFLVFEMRLLLEEERERERVGIDIISLENIGTHKHVFHRKNGAQNAATCGVLNIACKQNPQKHAGINTVTTLPLPSTTRSKPSIFPHTFVHS